MPTGVYLYCIGHSDQLSSERVDQIDARPADGSDAPLRTVEYDDLAALVSDTKVQHFEIQRDGLMAHHHVLEAAMKLGDILPVSYGTVAATERDVLDGLLRNAADELRANLEHVHDRVELSLRVMWNQDRLFQEIVEEDREIRVLRDAVAGVPENQSYYDRIRLGELTSHAIVAKSEAEREQMLDRLAPIAADLRVNESTNDMLLLNASFLVDRERESAFDAEVQEIARPRQDRMIFRYLGPLPPASFVSVGVDAG